MLEIAVTAWLCSLAATALLLVGVVAAQALRRWARTARLSGRPLASGVREAAPVRSTAPAPEFAVAGNRVA